MLKTFFVLSMSLAIAYALPVRGQSSANVTFTVTVVDSDLNLKHVPKFPLIVRKAGSTVARITTSADGRAIIGLPPGKYVVESEAPLLFQKRSFAWELSFTVDDSTAANVELSNDNAKVMQALGTPVDREISRGGEMFRTLRDGVVTVQGELEPGTGFIIDASGLVLTNHHVIDGSNEIRVRFDKNTAVRARVLAVASGPDGVELAQVERAVVVARREIGFGAVVEVADVMDGHEIPVERRMRKLRDLGAPVAIVRWSNAAPPDHEHHDHDAEGRQARPTPSGNKQRDERAEAEHGD